MRISPTRQFIDGRGERRVNDAFFRMIDRALNLVVVERKLAGERAI